MEFTGTPGLVRSRAFRCTAGFWRRQGGSELGVTALRLSTFGGELLGDNIAALGYDITDHGDADIVKPDRQAAAAENPKYLVEMLESFENMSASLTGILEAGEMPIILGGDHSIAIGTFSAISRFFRAKGEEIGLIWFDAHADINTSESSPSGNIHGMPLAAILGYGHEDLVNFGGFAPKLNPKYCAHVGARDLDLGEKKRIHALGMRDNFLTMTISTAGDAGLCADAIPLQTRRAVMPYLRRRYDLPVCTRLRTLVRGGTTYREAHLALEIIPSTADALFEIVEVNPMLDQSNIRSNLPATDPLARSADNSLRPF